MWWRVAVRITTSDKRRVSAGFPGGIKLAKDWNIGLMVS